jgi:hypothetical protein
MLTECRFVFFGTERIIATSPFAQRISAGVKKVLGPNARNRDIILDSI